LQKINSIVYAGLPEFMNNKVLDKEYMTQFHGGEAIYQLLNFFILKGFNVQTLDIYQNEKNHYDAYLISDMCPNVDFNKFYKLSAFLTYSLESPIIANRFYFYLNYKIKNYKYLLSWVGTKNLIKAKSKIKFLPIFWPNTINTIPEINNWNNREFLIMISGNKEPFKWQKEKINFGKITIFIKSLFSNTHTFLISNTLKIMKLSTYKEKINCINYFSLTNNFHLYGKGWDLKYFENSNYKGQIKEGPSEKLKILSKYKFSLCFENTIFDGYITEKIFDCFFTGVIPIYNGPIDIEKYIPKECFINYKNFKNLSDLNFFLTNLKNSDIEDYHNSTKLFLNSNKYEIFTHEYFINHIFKLIQNT